MKHTGWRKPTLETGVVRVRSQTGESRNLTKGQCLASAKRVGIQLGLRAADLLLLDMLVAFSQEQDWETGHRPIVWPSNDLLTARTGFSRSALKRHVRKLAEFGLISFVDSPNGKRWGRRDADGHIVEAYGIELTPMRDRVEEFDALEKTYRAETALIARVRRQITTARRDLRAFIEAARLSVPDGPWDRLSVLLDRLLARLPNSIKSADRLARVLYWLRRIQCFASAVLRTPTKASQTQHQPDPSGPENEPHILTTNQLVLVKSTPTPSHHPVDKCSSDRDHTRKHNLPYEPDIDSILHACPDVVTWIRHLGYPIRRHEDILAAIGRLLPMIGIRDNTWHMVSKNLDRLSAAATIALVFQKTCMGAISFPDRYLRELSRRAELGELRIAASIAGLLKARPISNASTLGSATFHQPCGEQIA